MSLHIVKTRHAINNKVFINKYATFDKFSSLWAQTQNAITTASKKVILKADGACTYANGKSGRIQKLCAASSSNVLQGSNSSHTQQRSRSTKTSRNHIRGPRAGCYYINGSGSKTYVDRSMCN